MNVIRDFFATLYKMFAADLVMTALALTTVAICAAAAHLIGVATPFLLAAGVACALIVAVVRGAKI